MTRYSLSNQRDKNMNKEKNIKKVIDNRQTKLEEKIELYMEMLYIKTIQKVADGIIPYKKDEYENLPYVGDLS
jgi:hypothetical protein